MSIARRVIAALFVAGWVLLQIPAVQAGEEPVDLELILAVDVSWSMDPDEQALQRDGYVQAFRDPQVKKAVQAGPHRRIAVTYIEWAGPQWISVVVPWTVIASDADAEQLADRLAALPITRHRMTSISAALDFAGRQFRVNALSGTRRVIDISGDGPNNAGPFVTPIRDRLVADGIVINGLPIVLKPGHSTSMFDLPNLEDYYAQCVIGGPGSFIIPVKERHEFATATRQKLLMEIAGLDPPPRLIPAQAGALIDCTVGEQLWNRYMNR